MGSVAEICRHLEKEKKSIVRELKCTNILTALVKEEVITTFEEELINRELDDNVKGDLFFSLLSKKSVDAFKNFVYIVEQEAPHILNSVIKKGSRQMNTEEITYADSEKELDEELAYFHRSERYPHALSGTLDRDRRYSHKRDDFFNRCIITDDAISSDRSECCSNNCKYVKGYNNEVIILPDGSPASSIEMYQEPVDEDSGERVVWEIHQVTLNRVPGYGFGIAVSGGRDNPHFTNGDPSIAISDVLKAGPAEGKLLVNDRIMSANGVSLDGVEYATAVQVLRDSGNTVQLVVRRRVVLPSSPEPQTLRVQITKSRKKDDFGIVLGTKIYVKDVGTKLEGNSLQEGDIILKINNYSTDGMNLKEARKLIEGSKEKVNLLVRREMPRTTYATEPTAIRTKEGNYMDGVNNYASQNVYVQPPTRLQLDDKSNLAPRGRSRGPLMDPSSISQVERSSSPLSHAHSRSRSGVEEAPDPPRPPPPRSQDYYSSSRHLYEDDSLHERKIPEPRLITFLKEGSVGIRLTGGNEVGIFVTAVQPGSPAALQGLQPGDKILKVNDMDLKGITREEAVLLLLSLQDQIQLIVQHRREEYEHVVANQRGDSFHIKAHFNYEQPNKGEMTFRKGDIFHVIDTLHNGVVGSWQVYKIGRNNQEVQQGIIPNKARAEELATAQFNANKKEANNSESRGSFFRRRRNSHRRSKSLSKDHWDDVVFGDSVSKFPAYERVVLRHPGFMRPVVLFGPVADLAREKLLKDFPDKFSSPHLDSNIEEVAKSAKTSGIIRLSAIREIMDRGKHALLDITPNAVDRLNYAQFYPIVVFLRADSKHIVKELRAGMSKTVHKSSKKLFEQSQKVEKAWGHVFSATVPLSSPESWYRKIRELIDKNQTAPVWMSESKPEEALADDFLFPMGSLRLSYASSPESDLEATPGALGPTGGSPRLVKCSSDPSIATQPDGSPKLQHPPPYSPPHNHALQTYEGHIKPRRSVEKYGMLPPELPPRIDRAVKPPRTSTNSQRSAQERLFGSEPPNYINATPHVNQSSLDRHNNNKSNSYDSVSSYDSYNNQRLGLGPNAHDDLKSCNGGPGSPQRQVAHDPYRFTRSTQQPIKDSPSKIKPPDYPKYRPPGIGEFSPSKPLPPTKPPSSQHSYKPIPPPKPKNYRPPHQSYYPQSNGYQHSKSFSTTENNYSSHLHNGVSSLPNKYGSESTEMNGHGSSLDRSTYGRSGGQQQYYYNVVPSPRQSHNREPSGLDLAHRADQRGSAFELYKKPTDPNNHYNIEHGLSL
ncbi:tight junction protein ZO-1-like [Cimex lectularius]|uniref:Tight junction protein ZO-1 n=1 Tax=Cimex lectularius TaxID=79782 RepID=A0A8I6SPG7_CIMLE|nr:tight junction protein ZO-1-like [Cimex lectularius]